MRNISRFEVGTIPARPQTFQFYDEEGNVANLGAYTEFDIELIGSDNEQVDISDSELRVGAASTGRITLVWPRRSDVFSKQGKYLLRFKFSGFGSIDFSDTHEIRVTEFGRLRN